MLRVSPSTVWRWIEADRLPAYRVGPRNIRIRRDDLDRVIRPVRAEREEVAPPVEPLRLQRPSKEEIARRQALVKEILANRGRRTIAPLTSVDLVQQVREEERRAYGRPKRTR